MDDAGGGKRGRKPSLTDAMARALVEVWGCDLERAVEFGGSTGLNLLADIDGREVVVRVHRAHVTVARVEALQLARDVAAAAGLPAARAIPGRRGERCLAVDSCVIEVEHFVASDQKMDTLARIRSAMPTLARLHDALTVAELPPAAAEASFANYLSAREAAVRTAEGASRIRTLDSALHPIATAAEDLARDLVESLPIFDALPPQWCHGDFWDNNVLFRGDDVVLIADFGFMGRRPRIDDLALTLYFTLWDLLAGSHADPLGTLVALVAAYDAGTTSPLSDAERQALPLAIARQPLWSVGVWAAELDDDHAVATHLNGHDVALQLGRNILESIDRWNEALRH